MWQGQDEKGKMEVKMLDDWIEDEMSSQTWKRGREKKKKELWYPGTS